MKIDYVPNTKDIICLKPGIMEVKSEIEFNFEYSPIYKMINIGGQTLETKQWDLFDKANLVVFVSSLIDFDKEDGKQMKSSIQLFKEVCQNLKSRSIALFLTRGDLLELLLQEGKSINKCFEDYDGINCVDDTIEYIKSQFLNEIDINEGFLVYTHIVREGSESCIQQIHDIHQNIFIEKLMEKLMMKKPI